MPLSFLDFPVELISFIFYSQQPSPQMTASKKGKTHNTGKKALVRKEIFILNLQQGINSSREPKSS